MGNYSRAAKPEQGARAGPAPRPATRGQRPGEPACLRAVYRGPRLTVNLAPLWVVFL